jgi:hypothetical protein
LYSEIPLYTFHIFYSEIPVYLDFLLIVQHSINILMITAEH